MVITVTDYGTDPSSYIHHGQQRQQKPYQSMEINDSSDTNGNDNSSNNGGGGDDDDDDGDEEKEYLMSPESETLSVLEADENDMEVHRKTQPARVGPFGAFSNIVKTFAGAGSFALPWSLQQSGILAGLISIVLLALLSDYTMILLVKCRRFVQAQEEYRESSDHWKWRGYKNADGQKIPPPHKRAALCDNEGVTDETTDVTDVDILSYNSEQSLQVQSLDALSVSTAGETLPPPISAPLNKRLRRDQPSEKQDQTERERVRELDTYLYNPHRTFTYIDLAYEAMGRPGSVLMSLLLFSCNLGVCTVYWVFLSSLMSSMVSISSSPATDQRLWILFTLPIFIALNCVRSYKYFAPFAVLGTLALVTGLGCVVLYGFLYHAQDLKWPWEYGDASWFRPATYPLSFGVTCFLFNTHAMVLPIEQSLRKRRWYPPALHASFLFIAVLNLAFALLVFLFFGEDIKQDATANLLPGVFVYAIKSALIFELITTFPLVMQPIAETIDENALRSLRSRSTTLFLSASTVTRVLLVLIVFAVAMLAGDRFGIVMGFIGAVSPNLMGYVAPPLLYLILLRRHMSIGAFIFNCALVVFGFIAMIASVSVAVMEVFGSS